MTTPNVRYEIKMACEGLLAMQVETWVNLHSWGFHTTYPPRQVNNIYFDTPDLDSFNDHVESLPLRRKLRFRWYGTDLRRAHGQIEVKNKSERAGWKLIQPVEPTLELDDLDWVATMRILRENSTDVFRELIAVSRPVNINTYRRKYFVSGNEHIRLTLDYHLTVYDQWMAARPNLTFRMPFLDEIIIELKSDVAYHHEVADVLAEFPLRVERYSKYIGAVDGVLER